MHRLKQKFGFPYYPLLISVLFISSIVLPIWFTAGSAMAAGNPLAGATLYIDPASGQADDQAAAWRTSRPADAAMMDLIATRPKAFWMGDRTPDSQDTAAGYTSRAAASGGVGVIVAYNIPQRDCGSYSGGGASSHPAYRAWIDGMAAGIGARRTVVILEPDALPQLVDCLNAAEKQARLDSISYAVSKLKSNPAVSVYLDAGNKGWVSAAAMAPRLQSANIGAADGFSVNVSNFFTTTESIAFGSDLSGRLGGKHYVIDTSRNGQGSNGEWCNPAGRGLGHAPSTNTGNGLVDAFLWIKGPGESDGTCSGGPFAGTWWPEYALGLAQRASLGGGGNTTLPSGGGANARTKTLAGGGAAPSAPASPTGSVLATQSAAASANAKFAQTGFWLSQRDRYPLYVSGLYKIPGIPDGAKQLLVTLDGSVMKTTAVDTAYLKNGFHILAVSFVDASGAVHESSARLYVQNKLSPFEMARNTILAASAFPQTVPGAAAIAVITLGAGLGLLLPKNTLLALRHKLRRRA